MRAKILLLKFIGFIIISFILLFLILNLIPIDPSFFLAGPFATQETIQKMHNLLGLDKPIFVRFFKQLWNIFFTGNIKSFYYNQSVYKLLYHQGKYSIAALTIIYIISFTFAFITSLFFKPRSRKLINTVNIIFQVSLVPPYIYGIFTLWILSFFGVSPIKNIYIYWSFMILISSYHPMALTMLTLIKGIENENETKFYPMLYYAKGFSPLKINLILIKRFIPQAIAQLIALFAYILSSIFFCEYLFNLPGIGNLLITSTFRNDRAVILVSGVLLSILVYSTYLIGELTISRVYKSKPLFTNQ